MYIAAVEAVGRKRRKLEERRAGIDQEIDALPRQHLAARRVTGARGFPASVRDLVELVAQLRDKTEHHLAVTGKIGRRSIKARLDLHDRDFLTIAAPRF